MNFEFFCEEVEFPDLRYDTINTWLKEVIESNIKSCGSVSIIFCSDEYLLKINQQYLKHDYFTDIITFNYSSAKVISGDLFISLDTVKSNSELYSVSFFHELHRVIVHGILHLLGWEDKTEIEATEMRKLEDFWLEKISFAF